MSRLQMGCLSDHKKCPQGLKPVLIANGHVYPEVDTAHLGATYREPQLVYWNQGNGKFKDISHAAGPGCTEPQSSRGLAIADFWNEGRLSAVINNSGAKPMLLVNQESNPNHWIGISTVGTRSNRDGIGATVHVSVGSRDLVQEVRSGSSYLSSSDLRLHFGLGAAAKVDRLEIEWPSGLRESFSPPSGDHFITLTEGTGKALAAR